jgi:hypothetical protein
MRRAMTDYKQSKYCKSCWVEPKNLEKQIANHIEELNENPAKRVGFLTSFGKIEFGLSIYHDQHLYDDLMINVGVLTGAFEEAELARYCQTQHVQLRSESGFREHWSRICELQTMERHQYIANLALKEFATNRDIDKERNCIVELFINPFNANDSVKIYVTVCLDAHFTFCRCKETIAYQVAFPKVPNKSGSGGVDYSRQIPMSHNLPSRDRELVGWR